MFADPGGVSTLQGPLIESVRGDVLSGGPEFLAAPLDVSVWQSGGGEASPSHNAQCQFTFPVYYHSRYWTPIQVAFINLFIDQLPAIKPPAHFLFQCSFVLIFHVLSNSQLKKERKQLHANFASQVERTAGEQQAALFV